MLLFSLFLLLPSFSGTLFLSIALSSLTSSSSSLPWVLLHSLFRSLFYSKEWNAICRSRDAEQVAFFLTSHFLSSLLVSWEKLCTSLIPLNSTDSTHSPFFSFIFPPPEKTHVKSFFWRNHILSRGKHTPSPPLNHPDTWTFLEEEWRLILVLIPCFFLAALDGKRAQLSPRFSWPMSGFKWSLSHDWFQGKRRFG